MKQITAITDDAKQTLAIVLEDGSRVSFALNYIAAQNGWFYSIAYGDFISLNRRLVNSPNMLRQFRQILPFGISCTITDGYEPVYIDDFVSGRASLYVLNEEEVAEVETLITITLPTFVGYPLD